MAVAAKRALRKQVQEVLKKLTPEERTTQSAEIFSKLVALPEYKNSRRVSVFLSREDEVSTDEIVIDLLKSNKSCYIPKQLTGDDMEMVKIESVEELKTLSKNSFGIREVSVSEEREDALASGGLDLMILPGLAFTATGKRLGKGKGYYDRYILKARNVRPPVLVGIAFRQQIVPDIPVTENDIDADIVISP